MDTKESRVIVSVCCMICVMIIVVSFFMTGCEERSARYRLELSAQQLKYYEDNGYIREYHKWEGFIWVKPENKEADNAKNQD